MGDDITLRPVNPHYSRGNEESRLPPFAAYEGFSAVKAQQEAKRAKRTDFSWHNQCFYSAVFKSMRTRYVAFQT